MLTDASRAANFTNEGGVDGRVRYLRNVMGLWLLSETLRSGTWQRDGRPRAARLLAAAAALDTPRRNSTRTTRVSCRPGDMPVRIGALLCRPAVTRPRRTPAEFARSIVESLAEAFATTLGRRRAAPGVTINTVHIVGGGSQNRAALPVDR